MEVLEDHELREIQGGGILNTIVDYYDKAVETAREAGNAVGEAIRDVFSSDCCSECCECD